MAEFEQKNDFPCHNQPPKTKSPKFIALKTQSLGGQNNKLHLDVRVWCSYFLLLRVLDRLTILPWTHNIVISKYIS